MDPRKLGAEFLGTFWLVFGGCGSAMIAAAFMPDTNLGIGLVGVSLAFGLTVLTGAYALGHISGGHFNPAVTLGLWVGGRFPGRDLIGYWVAQVLGAIVASGVLVVIANGQPGFDLNRGGKMANMVAANGYGKHSPGLYDLTSGLIIEVILTAIFIYVILSVTRKDAPVGFAPIAIGLTLTLIHLISIPVTNTSVNPARSTGPALLQGGWAINQLWLFWLAPLVGGALGALIHRGLTSDASLPDVVGGAVTDV